MACQCREGPILDSESEGLSSAPLGDSQQVQAGHETKHEELGKSMDVTTIGVDVMKVQLPGMEKSVGGFVDTMNDQVRHSSTTCLPLSLLL